MTGRLDEMVCERRCMDGLVLEKMKRDETMKARLLELKKLQGAFAKWLDRAKEGNTRLTVTLKERTERCVEMRQKPLDCSHTSCNHSEH